MEELSGLDAAFVYLETPNQHLHVSLVMVLDPAGMPGGYSFDGLKRHLAARLHRVPLMRRRLAVAPFSLGRPVWVDTDTDIDVHMQATTCPAPGDEAALAGVVGELASTPLDRSRPLWEVWVVEGLAGDRVGLVIKVHHCAIDGVGGAEALAHLFDLDPESSLAVPEPVGLRHEPRPAGWQHLARAAVGRARRTAQLVPLATRSTVAAAQAVQRRRREEPRGALPLSGAVAPWNGSLSQQRSFSVTHLPLDEMKGVAASFDVTMNDVVLAVCAGSMRRFLLDRFELPEQPLVAMCPVSVSGSLPAERRSANRVSVMFPSLATDLDDPLERLRAIHESSLGAKAEQRLLGPSLVLDWAEHLTPVATTLAGSVYAGRGLSARHRPLQNALISNVPGPPIPLYFAGAEVLAAYPLGPAMEGCGLNITVFSYQGTVGFGFLACPELLPDGAELAAGIRSAFDELLALVPAATPLSFRPERSERPDRNDRPERAPGPITTTPRRTRSTNRRRVPA